MFEESRCRLIKLLSSTWALQWLEGPSYYSGFIVSPVILRGFLLDMSENICLHFSMSVCLSKYILVHFWLLDFSPIALVVIINQKLFCILPFSNESEQKTVSLVLVIFDIFEHFCQLSTQKLQLLLFKFSYVIFLC